MKTVLITGGAGFLGSHLVDWYLGHGETVVAVDNFMTSSRRNLSHLAENDKFAVVEHDVTLDFSRVLPSIERFGRPKIVLHFASPASPVDYGRYPIETMRANSIGTERALLAAKEWRASFLYASTSESYGDPTVHPQTESYWGNVNPTGERSCYDESKRYGEALVSTFARSGSDVRIIRIFNTYGPRMALDDGRVVPNFIKQALLGQPLTVYGDGSQTRSFCYVSDLVEGIARCAASPKTRGLVTNLGSPREERISEFARIVAGIVGVPFRCEYRPLPADDPMQRCPDITRARTLLDWEPIVELENGLRQTIDDFSARIHNGGAS
jgi:dTDP-glucose 4,6-dehydratase